MVLKEPSAVSSEPSFHPSVSHLEHMLIHNGGLHDVPPIFVHCRETPSLLRHLGHDVRGAENGLQIEPNALDLQPFVHDFLPNKKVSNLAM